MGSVKTRVKTPSGLSCENSIRKLPQICGMEINLGEASIQSIRLCRAL